MAPAGTPHSENNKRPHSFKQTRTMSDPDSDKTRLIRRSNPQPPTGAPAPQRAGRDPEETVYVHGPDRDSRSFPDETRIIGRGPTEERTPPPPAPPLEDGRTVLVRPSSRRQENQGAQVAPEAPAQDDFLPEGPVVGWLVVIRGPGKGRSVTLGYGMNPIGRDADNRISLPYGDEQISRKKHATITYDPRGRKFYLLHGESSNLTYIGEIPVLAPTILTGGETIRLGGETEVRFVPLCGEDFDWENLE